MTADAGSTQDLAETTLADPLEEGMAIHLVFLPGKSCGQKSLAGYSPWGCKKSDMTE